MEGRQAEMDFCLFITAKQDHTQSFGNHLGLLKQEIV